MIWLCRRPPTLWPSSRCTAIGNSVCMNRANASASSTKNRDGFGHPHRRLVDVLLAGDVSRPRAAVDAALRGAAGLDVDAAGAFRHHQFAVEHDVEAGGRFTFGARSGPARKVSMWPLSHSMSSCSSVSFSNRNSVRSSSRQAFLAHVVDPSWLPITPRPNTGAPTSPPSTLRRRRPPPVWRIRRAHHLQQTHRAHLFPNGAAAGPASTRRRRCRSGPARMNPWSSRATHAVEPLGARRRRR